MALEIREGFRLFLEARFYKRGYGVVYCGGGWNFAWLLGNKSRSDEMYYQLAILVEFMKLYLFNHNCVHVIPFFVIGFNAVLL